jgi:pimeloyl-ACP methyl ester carboxylesterase
MMSETTEPAVLLIHGGFADGSGWRGVYDRLRAQGHRVLVVQHPTLSLEGDVAATKQLLDELDGPAILVGHSYGGVVVTETGSDPRVAGLVYIAAFAPDKGESVNTLIADPPPGAPVPPILPPRDGSTSTGTSSTSRSPATCPPTRLPSWPTHRSRGASKRSPAA